MKIPYFLIILTVYLATEFSEGQKYKCETPKLKNGKVRIRSKGQVVRFRCRKRFKLAGAKIALCLNDEWNFPVPVCVAPGKKCPKQKFSKDLLVTESLNRGFLEISCKPGLTLVGKDKIYCDGSQWSDEAAKCVYDNTTEATTVPLVTTTYVNTETESSGYQSAPPTETDSTANPTTDNNRHTPAMSTAISETPFHKTGHFVDTTTLSEFTDLYSKTQIPTHLTSVATKRKSKVSTSHPAKIDSTTVLKPNMRVNKSTTKSLATTKLRMTTEQYINITTTGSNTDTDTTEPITHINTEPTRLTQTTEDLTTYTTPGPKQETKITEQPSTKAKPTEQSTTSATVKSSERTKTTEKLTTLTTTEPSRRSKTTEKLTTVTTAEPSREAKATEQDNTLTTIKPSQKATVTEKPTATTNKGTIITTQSTTTPTPEPKKTTTFPPSSTQKPQKPTTSPPTTTEIKTTTAASAKTSSIPSIQSTTVTRSTDSTASKITSTTQSVSSEISHYSTYRATTTPSNPTSSSTSLSKTTLSVNTTTTPVQSTTESMDFNNTINEDIVPATKAPQNDTDIPNVIVASRQSVPDDTPIKPLVIGLGVGVAIGLVILIVGSYLWVRRRRRKEEECDEMRPITGTGSQEW